MATDSWSAVPAIHKDITEVCGYLSLSVLAFISMKFLLQEPFIDLSVGGNEIPNGDPDELQVVS